MERARTNSANNIKRTDRETNSPPRIHKNDTGARPRTTTLDGAKERAQKGERAKEKEPGREPNKERKSLEERAREREDSQGGESQEEEPGSYIASADQSEGSKIVHRTRLKAIGVRGFINLIDDLFHTLSFFPKLFVAAGVLAALVRDPGVIWQTRCAAREQNSLCFTYVSGPDLQKLLVKFSF